MENPFFFFQNRRNVPRLQVVSDCACSSHMSSVKLQPLLCLCPPAIPAEISGHPVLVWTGGSGLYRSTISSLLLWQSRCCIVPTVIWGRLASQNDDKLLYIIMANRHCQVVVKSFFCLLFCVVQCFPSCIIAKITAPDTLMVIWENGNLCNLAFGKSILGYTLKRNTLQTVQPASLIQ